MLNQLEKTFKPLNLSKRALSGESERVELFISSVRVLRVRYDGDGYIM